MNAITVNVAVTVTTLVQTVPIVVQVVGIVILAVPEDEASVPDKVVVTLGKSVDWALVFHPCGITFTLNVVPTGTLVAEIPTDTGFVVVLGRVISAML